MHGCTRRYGFRELIVALLLAFSQSAAAPAADLASTWRDDASLNAVYFVGSKNGYTVGAQGAIWKTADAGQTWQPVASGATCQFNSVCFLTDQIGWIAGSEISPFTGLDSGVLLFTE